MTVTTFLIFAACLWRILTLAADLSISGTLLYQERVWFRVERYREKLRGPVLDFFVVWRTNAIPSMYIKLSNPETNMSIMSKARRFLMMLTIFEKDYGYL